MLLSCTRSTVWYVAVYFLVSCDADILDRFRRIRIVTKTNLLSLVTTFTIVFASVEFVLEPRESSDSTLMRDCD